MIKKYDQYTDHDGHFYHVADITGDIITLRSIRNSSFEKTRTVIVKKNEINKRFEKTIAGEVKTYHIGEE